MGVQVGWCVQVHGLYTCVCVSIIIIVLYVQDSRAQCVDMGMCAGTYVHVHVCVCSAVLHVSLLGALGAVCVCTRLSTQGPAFLFSFCMFFCVFLCVLEVLSLRSNFFL